MEESKFYKISKKQLLVCLLIFILYQLYLSVAAFIEIPKLEKLLSELFEGEKVPLVTQWLISTYRFLWIIPFILVLFALALLNMRTTNNIFPILLFLTTLLALLLMHQFIIYGMLAPFLQMVSLGG